MLGEVEYNERITSWRFRVKILISHSLYSYVSGRGPYWVYILTDEDGAKMEMTINEVTAKRFESLQKEEGKWVEIFQVEVGHAFPGFKETNSPYRLTTKWYTQIHIIDPLNNWHYMEFKNIHEIPHISSRYTNYPICMNPNH